MTNAEIMRKTLNIFRERGGATGRMQDDNGLVCPIGAYALATRGSVPEHQMGSEAQSIYDELDQLIAPELREADAMTIWHLNDYGPRSRVLGILERAAARLAASEEVPA